MEPKSVRHSEITTVTHPGGAHKSKHGGSEEKGLMFNHSFKKKNTAARDGEMISHIFH